MSGWQTVPKSTAPFRSLGNYIPANGTFIYNKAFDEDEWEASIRTKCFFINGSQQRELSNLVQQRKITRDENIVYVRDSWVTQRPEHTGWKEITYGKPT